MSKNQNKEFNEFFKGYTIAGEVKDILKGNGKKKEAFNKYINENSFSSKFIDSLMCEQKVTILIENYTQENKFESAKLLEQRMKRRKTIKTLRKRITVSLFAATSALIVLSFVLRFEPTQEIKHSMPAKVLTPTLTLSDGTNINLEDEKSEPIDGVHIDKEEKKMIVYKATKLMQVSHNVITVPSKYTYNVVLEDGTEVFLNANSELRYPSQFNGEKREVFLKGEGYFHVKKSDKPFIVTTSDLNIKVYGTTFNINTNTENMIETVLVSGSIGVTIKDGDQQEIMITPNQLFLFNRLTKENRIENVNPTNYVAWMKGQFKCDNENLHLLLSKIALWYDVTFEYENKEMKNSSVSVNLNRASNLDSILEALGAVAGVEFVKINEKKYVVR